MRKELSSVGGIKLSEEFSDMLELIVMPEENPFLVVTNMEFDENKFTGTMMNIRTLSDTDFQAAILDHALELDAKIDFVHSDVIILQAPEDTLAELKKEYDNYASTVMLKNRGHVDLLKEKHFEQMQETEDLRKSDFIIDVIRPPH